MKESAKKGRNLLKNSSETFLKQFFLKNNNTVNSLVINTTEETEKFGKVWQMLLPSVVHEQIDNRKQNGKNVLIF